MDGQRFDELTRTVAMGTSRRRVLRLAGGGVAAALLGVLGRGRRVEADGEAPSALLARCYADSGCPVDPNSSFCISTSLAPTCVAYYHIYSLQCGPGRPGCGNCQEPKVCVAAINPGGEVQCRCLNLTS